MKKTEVFIITAVLIITTVLLTGCESPLAPFDSAAVNQFKDKSLAEIIITSPESDTPYEQIVTITGEVSDDGNILPELTYTVSDSLGSQQKSGSIELAEQTAVSGVKAGFSFQFSTSEYTSDILLEINGTDWNGNVSIPVKLRLIFPGNTIPSFLTTAASKTIACNWDAVEGASSYRIFYTTDGSIPYENYGESSELLTEASTASSPYVINDLENGAPHVVRLMAYSADGDSWSSELHTVVPSSQLTFMPRVESGYGEIRLEWNDLSDGYGYEVYRSEGLLDTRLNISGTITGCSFTDNRVDDDTAYYYYVRPAVPDAGLSAGAACYSFPLSTDSDRTVGQFTDLKYIEEMEVVGTKAYLLDKYGNLIIFDISSPEFPVQLGTWENLSQSTGWDIEIAIFGNYAYISKSYYIYRVNISNPASPFWVDTIQPDDTAKVSDVAVHDDKLYATVTYQSTNAQEGIYCYSIDPDGSLNLGDGWNTAYNFPTKAKICTDRSGNGDIFVNYYHGSGYITGLLKVSLTGEITDVISQITTGVANNYTYYYGAAVDIANDLIVCMKKDSNGYSLLYFHASTGASFGAEQDIEGTTYKGAYIDSDMLYVVMGYYMYTYQLSCLVDEYSSVNLYTTQLQSNSVGIDSAADDITVCGIGNGLQLINSKRKAASVSMFDEVDYNANVCDISGDIIYLAGSSLEGSLAAYSIADKAELQFLGRAVDFDSSRVYDMIAAGDYVFLLTAVDGDNGVYVLDVSDPSSIYLTGSFVLGSSARGMILKGDYLFVFSGGFIEILDVSNPAYISRISWEMPSTSSDGDTAVKGNYLFVGFNDSLSDAGLTVMDISDPAEPVIVKELTGVRMDTIALSGDKLYGYSKANELTVYDISDPENPVHLQDISCIMTDEMLELAESGIHAVDNFLFFHGVDDGDNLYDDGLHIYNTENPAVVDRLEFISLYDEGAGELGYDNGEIKTAGKYLYIAADKLFCFDIAP